MWFKEQSKTSIQNRVSSHLKIIWPYRKIVKYSKRWLSTRMIQKYLTISFVIPFCEFFTSYRHISAFIVFRYLSKSNHIKKSKNHFIYIYIWFDSLGEYVWIDKKYISIWFDSRAGYILSENLLWMWPVLPKMSYLVLQSLTWDYMWWSVVFCSWYSPADERTILLITSDVTLDSPSWGLRPYILI